MVFSGVFITDNFIKTAEASFTIDLLSTDNAGSTSVITSSSISPSANTLVVAVYGALSGTLRDIDSFSSTFATDGWTVLADERTATDVGGLRNAQFAVAYAVTTSSPGSGTVTVDMSGNQNNLFLMVYEISGFDSSDPFVQYKSAENVIPSLTITLDATPDSSNLVIGHYLYGQDTDGYINGSGFTDLGTVSRGNNTQMSVQYTDSPTDADVDASDMEDQDSIFGLAIEVAAEPAPSNSLPVASDVSIDSDASSVTLNEGTTKDVVCSGTVTDSDGYAEITSVTADFYRTSIGTSLAENNNYYYQLVGDSECIPSDGSGNSETYTCTFPVQFYADPTDSGSPYEADNWTCNMTPSDSEGAGTSASDTIEMASLIAVSVTSSIDYGTLSANTDTGSINETVTVTNTGNRSIDNQMSGTDMISGENTLNVEQQKYSLTSFNYSSGGTSLTTTATTITLELSQPQSTTTPVTDVVYFGIGIPSSQASGTYTGTNTLTATADSVAGPTEATLVQSDIDVHNYSSPSTSHTASLGSTATAGNLLVTAISIDKTAGSITVPTGFTLVHDYISSAVSGAVAYKVATGGEQNITWNYDNSEESSVWVGEYSDLKTSGVLDIGIENDSGGSVTNSLSTGTSGNTSQAYELALVFFMGDSITNFEGTESFSNSFTTIAEATDGSTSSSGTGALFVGQKDLSSIGTVETTFSTTDVGDESYIVLTTFEVQ